MSVSDRGIILPERKSITQQALETVQNRQAERGSGVGTAERWAKIFEAITGHPVTPEDYAWSGIATKLAREGEKPDANPDNLVDTVGYVEVLDRIRHPKNQGIASISEMEGSGRDPVG